MPEPIIEIVSSPEPIVEITHDAEPVIEISAVGDQGAPGPRGAGVVFLEIGQPVPPDTPNPSLIVEPLP